jgi:hypothetical protein
MATAAGGDFLLFPNTVPGNPKTRIFPCCCFAPPASMTLCTRKIYCAYQICQSHFIFAGGDLMLFPNTVPASCCFAPPPASMTLCTRNIYCALLPKMSKSFHFRRAFDHHHLCYTYCKTLYRIIRTYSRLSKWAIFMLDSPCFMLHVYRPFCLCIASLSCMCRELDLRPTLHSHN